jgi:hypothetical protein
MMVFMPGLVFFAVYPDPALLPSSEQCYIKVGRVRVRLIKLMSQPSAPDVVLEDEPVCECPDDDREYLFYLALNNTSTRLDNHAEQGCLGRAASFTAAISANAKMPRGPAVSLIYAFCSLRI